MTFVNQVIEPWLEWEIAQWVHDEGSIRRPIILWVNGITRKLYKVVYKGMFMRGGVREMRENERNSDFKNGSDWESKTESGRQKKLREKEEEEMKRQKGEGIRKNDIITE